MIEFDSIELRQIILDAYKQGYSECIQLFGLGKTVLSLSESYKLYGKRRVQSWIEKGIVHIHKDGERNSKIKVDRIELERAAKSSNRYERKI